MLASWKPGLGVLETRLGVLEAGLGVLEAGLGVLEARLGVLEARLGVLESGMGVLEARFRVLEARVSVLVARPDVFEAGPGVLETRLSVLEARLGVVRRPGSTSCCIPMRFYKVFGVKTGPMGLKAKKYDFSNGISINFAFPGHAELLLGHTELLPESPTGHLGGRTERLGG